MKFSAFNNIFTIILKQFEKLSGFFLIILFWIFSSNNQTFPEFITYFIAIICFYLIPLNLGTFSINLIKKYIKNTNYNQKTPNWVQIPINWLAGLFLLNIPAMLTGVFKIEFKFSFIVFYIVIWALYTYLKPDLKPNLLQNNTKTKTKINSKNTHLICLFAGIIVTFTYYYFWYQRTGFTSFSTDNLQNVHLANLLNGEKRFNLLAINLSGQYTQVDYLTVLTPLLSIVIYIIDFQKIMHFMAHLELVMVLFVYTSRYYLFRFLNIPPLSAALISLITAIMTFSGLYMPGTVYNQQILVFLLPSLIYFFVKKQNFNGFLLLFALFPFHFTMSLFLWFSTLSLWFFNSIYSRVKNVFTIGFFRFDKIIFICILISVLILEGVFTFETNYQITGLFLQILSSKPQFLNSIGIYSNLAVLQIMMMGMGPILAGTLFCIPIAWLFGHKMLERWVFTVISIQLMILSIPFPVAARTFVFFSIPFGLSVYFIYFKISGKNQIITQILLVISILAMFLSSLTIRNNDLDISGRYWKLPYLDQSYENYLIKSAKILETRGIKYQDYKVVSEFFVKQHFEVLAKKYDDNGVYEENKFERIQMYNILNNTNDKGCQIYKKKYLIYLINERVYKWSRIPASLSSLSSFAIWWSQPATQIESDYVTNFKPVIDGGQVDFENEFPGSNKLIIIKCSSND